MNIELRSDNTARIFGYVNVVGRESRKLADYNGYFSEIIKPKTFERALERGSRVGLMFNHVRDVTPLEFNLYEDNIGLYCDTVIYDDEVIQEARSGNLTGWSFGFNCRHDNWKTTDTGERVRTVDDLDLLEVSILTKTPAYIATSIDCRGGEIKLKEYRLSGEAVKVEDMPPPHPEPDLTLLKQQQRKFNFMYNKEKLKYE